MILKFKSDYKPSSMEVTWLTMVNKTKELDVELWIQTVREMDKTSVEWVK